jgi:hypothetical protein
VCDCPFVFALIRCILTRWVEKLAPLRRLTTIVMPHREKRASLRSNNSISAAPKVTAGTKEVSEFRTMNAIQVLKYGVEKRLNKPKGWLLRLLHKEGNVALSVGLIICLHVQTLSQVKLFVYSQIPRSSEG